MISDLIEFRKDVLFNYSQYSFLPQLNKDRVFNTSIKNVILNFEGNSDVESVSVDIMGFRHVFFVKFLPWDTDYFKINTYRLMYVLYEHSDYGILKKATDMFVGKFFRGKECYCFSEIPSEDIRTIQALNESGFKLVESRLTYYLDLRNYENRRYQVRNANTEDIINLKRVARLMRNDFDRFHAEAVFNSSLADEFLATFIEESIKGFSDCVIVPNEPNVPPDAFLTANYLNDEWDDIGEKISKMVLSAVSSESCKGWYIKLISEMAYHLKERGANYAFMHPATTNRAVIHSYEKLGCKYGKCVHVLTYSSKKNVSI